MLFRRDRTATALDERIDRGKWIVLLVITVAFNRPTIPDNYSRDA